MGGYRFMHGGWIHGWAGPINWTLALGGLLARIEAQDLLSFGFPRLSFPLGFACVECYKGSKVSKETMAYLLLIRSVQLQHRGNRA